LVTANESDEVAGCPARKKGLGSDMSTR
jgi:hypothetical protein